MQSQQAFIQALEQHQKIIHRVCSLYMSEPGGREDLFQEIVLNAWKGIHNFKGDAKFSTWLYRVALNTAITFYRKEQRLPLTSALHEQLNGIADNEPAADEQVKALYKAIGLLCKIDKALVMLYLEDYSYQEIGDIMGITPNYVAVKMNRIKTRLKEESRQFYEPA